MSLTPRKYFACRIYVPVVTSRRSDHAPVYYWHSREWALETFLKKVGCQFAGKAIDVRVIAEHPGQIVVSLVAPRFNRYRREPFTRAWIDLDDSFRAAMLFHKLTKMPLATGGISKARFLGLYWLTD